MKTFAKIRPEFIMLQSDIKSYNELPDNMPDIKLKESQKTLVSHLYRKYVGGKITRGWGQELFEVEMKEKWPSGPRMKTHEAKRIILNNLVELQAKQKLSVKDSAKMFFGALTCRDCYVTLIKEVYEIDYKA